MDKGIKTVNDGVNALLARYGGAKKHWQIDGRSLILGEDVVPLQEWRFDRKNWAIKSILDENPKTISKISVYSFAPKSYSLKDLFLSEVDLIFWWTGSRAEYVMAMSNGDAANVVIKLENQAVVTLELTTLLPCGAEPQYRHEINAVEGIISDRTVDTMVAQAGVYYYGPDGNMQYSDPDYLMYGLRTEDINKVYAAYGLVSEIVCAEDNIESAAKAEQAWQAYEQSVKTGGKVELKNMEVGK